MLQQYRDGGGVAACDSEAFHSPACDSGAFHSHDIHVGAASKQRCDDVGIVSIRLVPKSKVQRGVVNAIAHCHVCAVCQQGRDGVDVAGFGSKVQRSVTIVVLRPNARAVCQKRRDGLGFSVISSVVQRRLAFAIRSPHVRAFRQ